MTIRIFTIATNYYKEYFTEYFLPTINNIFQNHTKEVILFSDGLEEYNNKIYDNTCIHVKHIYDLYSFDIQFNKFNFINQELNNCNNNDLLIYADSDSMFCYNENAEKYILDNYRLNKFYISIHPIYLFDSEYTVNCEEVRQNVYSDTKLKGIFAYNLTEKPELITSFMVFNKQSFKEFFDAYNEEVYQMNKCVPRIMPTLNDEGIINYIYNVNKSNVDSKLFITINNNYENNVFDNSIIYIPWMNDDIGIYHDADIKLDKNNYVICNQKFNYNIKKQNKFNNV